MGVSTDAILFYGHCWEDEDVRIFGEGQNDDMEWAERLLRKRGVHCPLDDYPKEANDVGWEQSEKNAKAWFAANNTSIETWHAAKKAVEEEFGGIVLGCHCANECSMPYVAVKASETCAPRGFPKRIEWNAKRIMPDWDDKLDKWMTEMGVTKPHAAPGWWLVSYWG